MIDIVIPVAILAVSGSGGGCVCSYTIGTILGGSVGAGGSAMYIHNNCNISF